ncbi:unnamed protein product [Sphenostylis stenocarpa]|uniref:Uncharacterized protein n=1 Tax=Sphenostylis stenocarpa TaxID=92480 RepID=A0AA86VL09_9FABA|nr:unnamed protein product [Sphenostylis stenocarpa]
MEINRFNEQEVSEKKGRSIALKVEERSQESEEESENLGPLVGKFNKFLKKKIQDKEKHKSQKQLVIPKFIRFAWLDEEGFTSLRRKPKNKKLEEFSRNILGNIQPDLVDAGMSEDEEDNDEEDEQGQIPSSPVAAEVPESTSGQASYENMEIIPYMEQPDRSFENLHFHHHEVFWQPLPPTHTASQLAREDFIYQFGLKHLWIVACECG